MTDFSEFAAKGICLRLQTMLLAISLIFVQMRSYVLANSLEAGRNFARVSTATGGIGRGHRTNYEVATLNDTYPFPSNRWTGGACQGEPATWPLR